MQNEPEIQMYPRNKHVENHRRIQVIEFGGSQKTINMVFVRIVSKRGWQWSCYVTITCDKITKIKLVMHRRRQDNDVGR